MKIKARYAKCHNFSIVIPIYNGQKKEKEKDKEKANPHYH